MQISFAQFAGPIPPPQILAEYDRISPGAAGKIIDMAVSQAAHRQGLETTVVTGSDHRSTLGLKLGAGIALAVVGIGGALIFTGRPVSGFLLILVEAGSLAGIFVYSRRSQQKELTEKRHDAAQQTLPFPPN